MEESDDELDQVDGCDEEGNKGEQPDGSLDIRFFMMPVGEVELLDTWHTRGLRGTGTHHFQIEDHFVPEERTLGVVYHKTGICESCS